MVVRCGFLRSSTSAECECSCALCSLPVYLFLWRLQSNMVCDLSCNSSGRIVTVLEGQPGWGEAEGGSGSSAVLLQLGLDDHTAMCTTDKKGDHVVHSQSCSSVCKFRGTAVVDCDRNKSGSCCPSEDTAASVDLNSQISSQNRRWSATADCQHGPHQYRSAAASAELIRGHGQPASSSLKAGGRAFSRACQCSV